VHSQNPGIAFGVLADSASPWTRVFLIGGSVVVIAALAWLFAAGHSGGTLTAAGLALLLGGAAGNVTDRIFMAQSQTFSKCASATTTIRRSTWRLGHCHRRRADHSRRIIRRQTSRP